MALNGVTQDAWFKLERLNDSLIVPDDENDKYELMELIGQGGFGCVYKARSKEGGQLCAVKKLVFDVNGKNDRCVLREIKNGIRLGTHPNIVQFRDVFRSTSNNLLLVMDLCDHDLARHIADYPDNRRISHGLTLAKQIITGVDVLYSYVPAIIHRDVKPQNILILLGPAPDDVTAKIADFGLSGVAGKLHNLVKTTTGGIASHPDEMQTNKGSGTRPYLAPEFFEAKDRQLKRFSVDASVDIFALGLVFAYIFCYNSSDYGKPNATMILLKRIRSHTIQNNACTCTSVHQVQQKHLRLNRDHAHAYRFHLHYSVLRETRHG